MIDAATGHAKQVPNALRLGATPLVAERLGAERMGIQWEGRSRSVSPPGRGIKYGSAQIMPRARYCRDLTCDCQVRCLWQSRPCESWCPLRYLQLLGVVTMVIRNTLLMLAVVATAVMGSEPVTSPSAFASEGRLVGDAVVLPVSSEDGERADLLVLVKESGEVGVEDGAVDRLFRLQMDPTQSPSTAVQLEGVEVRWSPNDVRFDHQGREVLGIGVGELSEPVHERGLGLVQLDPGELAFSAIPLSESELDDLRTSLSDALYQEICECTSGGQGALSCAIPSGSCPGTPSGCGPVTCDSGYEPCCGCTDETGIACCMCIPPM